MSEFLRVERAGAVATIWIDRQAKMNTMTVAMRNEFPGIFTALERERHISPHAWQDWKRCALPSVLAGDSLNPAGPVAL